MYEFDTSAPGLQTVTDVAVRGRAKGLLVAVGVYDDHAPIAASLQVSCFIIFCADIYSNSSTSHQAFDQIDSSISQPLAFLVAAK